MGKEIKLSPPWVTYYVEESFIDIMNGKHTIEL